MGKTVYVYDSTNDLVSGIITTPPSSLSNFYTVELEDGSTLNAVGKDICTKFTVSAGGIASESLGFFAPDWLQQDAKVTYLVGAEYKRGFLSLDKDCLWEFVTRGHDGKIVERVPLPDPSCSWKNYIQENLLKLNWQDDVARIIVGRGPHVSAAHLVNSMAPANLLKSHSKSNQDATIWRGAYDK